MGSVAKSISSAGLEYTNSGIYTLLAETAISALPVSLTNSIPAAWKNGARLVIRAYNHITTGAITVAGTAPGSGAVVTETTTTIAVPEMPSQYVDYTTTNIYGAVNATGVSLASGTLTNGSITIYGIQKATRRLLGETTIDDKGTFVSPNIQHGYFVKDRYDIPTTADPEWGFAGPLFANNAMIWLQSAFSNNLTFTTVPASPTSLKTATSVSGSGNFSLTTQPNASQPAMILALVLGGTAPATAGSVTVTGTNIYGETLNETVIASTKTQGTYYSKNAFATVAANGVVFTAFGTGATLAVNGVICATASTTTPLTDGLTTFVIENYDSTSSKVAPFALTDEWGLEFGMNTEAKVTLKGKCQDVFLVGDLTSSTNQVTAPADEPEEALTGWEAVFYIDNASSSFGTTQNQDMISGKFDLKPNWKTEHTAQFIPPYKVISRAYRSYAEATAEFTFDMTQTTYNTEWVAFKQRRIRRIRIWVRGTPGYGVDSGTAYYPGFKLDMTGKWIDMPKVDWSNGKESVQITLPFRLFIDPVLAYAYNITWYSQLIAGWT